MSEFAGRSAIVTGGARGIGAALAKEQLGVMIADLLEPDGTAVAAALGPRAAFRHLDVTDEHEWQRVIDVDLYGGATAGQFLALPGGNEGSSGDAEP
ncbi:NAD(P)-dependent dehydrogenase (short-subunit alcohol dehydrogenase family) [Nocardia sp. GAS34]|uniref:hypothetical protein n=1 Tax=unclassified Nocardia TaxID=2637762 RepID=UPI003D23F74C